MGSHSRDHFLGQNRDKYVSVAAIKEHAYIICITYVYLSIDHLCMLVHT